MINKENTQLWNAEDGKFIIRKSDNKIMGKSIYLGEEDSIDNYEEREYTEDEYINLYGSAPISLNNLDSEVIKSKILTRLNRK